MHLYTDLHVLFGRGAMVWMDELLAEGHDVEYVDIGVSIDAPLPEPGPCDVNLIVAGIFAFQRFGARGLPRHGRNVVWLFDPLTRDDASEHRYKARLFDALAPRLDAVACMDDSVLGYLNTHFPDLPARRVPYVIAPATIAAPDWQRERSIRALWLGNDSPRRQQAARLFEAAGTGAQFRFGHVWGAERDRMRKDTRVILGIHADAHHTYFDQFRALEAWAAGCAVVAEHSADLAHQGIEPGVHLETAALEELPARCRDLLADEARLRAQVEAGQALLRREFSPARWRGDMLGLIAQAAAR